MSVMHQSFVVVGDAGWFRAVRVAFGGVRLVA